MSKFIMFKYLNRILYYYLDRKRWFLKIEHSDQSTRPNNPVLKITKKCN